MRQFHIQLRALPANHVCGGSVVVDGVTVNSLQLGLDFPTLPMAVSFEEASATLERLPRLFLEPDGSFVWVSSAEERPAWQVDGMLYDRDSRLMHVELKGNCGVQPIVQLLAACGDGTAPLMVEFVRAAVFATTAEFCRWLQCRSS